MMRKPTETLEMEHRIIEKVIAAMARLAESLEGDEEVKPERFSGLVDFMRVFADQCHHEKEETHLFPLLEHKGVPVTGCPIGVLTHEHTKGRELVNGLAEAVEGYSQGKVETKESLLSNLHGLVELYPNHIWKEEFLLFPMTEKILSAEEQQTLAEKFDQVEKKVGEDVHERFERMVEQWETW